MRQVAWAGTLTLRLLIGSRQASYPASLHCSFLKPEMVVVLGRQEDPSLRVVERIK